MTRHDDNPALDDEQGSGLVPRYFLDESARVDDDLITITGGKANRLKRVMRVRRDDPLELVHPITDRLYRASVERVTRDDVICRIDASRPLEPLPSPRIVLSASLIRPQRYDFMIEKATELGVDEIRPVWSQRAIIRGDAAQRLHRWRRLATEAAEQCRREYRPEIHAPVEVVDLIQESAGPSTLRLLASALEPDQRIAPIFQQRRQQGLSEPDPVHLLIGPEGGYTPEEADLARSHGWQPISLGNRPLRAETAAIIAVALTLEAARS
ncbi:MAG: 16S rRNA (uracil(1498)-N(3))-methyltransferase [Chloroflexi bacterium]|nr:16S rRNA (uracil(1498)-N(3))-methyltransferase [Chloroflexota bacterium]